MLTGKDGMSKTLTGAMIVMFWLGLATDAAAEDKVAFGTSRPPYVMQDASTGISIELFKLVYGRLERPFIPKYVGNVRMERSLSNGEVDVAVEVKKSDPRMFYSKEFVSYQNFIIVRQADKLRISDFTDLAGKSVCTWQQADEHLGQKFQAAMASFRYHEFVDQEAQVRVFLGGRCNTIIIDEKIFRYWVERLRGDPVFAKRIVSTDFFYQPVPGQSKNRFYVGFRDGGLRDRFDKELDALKTSGKYDEILRWKDWSKPPS